MEEVVLQARAKVNLTMDVLSRRADGYHEVDLLTLGVLFVKSYLDGRR